MTGTCVKPEETISGLAWGPRKESFYDRVVNPAEDCLSHSEQGGSSQSLRTDQQGLTAFVMDLDIGDRERRTSDPKRKGCLAQSHA